MCFQYLLRREFVLRLDVALPSESLKRLEQHLIGCGYHRDLFLRLCAGDPVLTAANARLEFEALMARASSAKKPWISVQRTWLQRLATPQLAVVLSALAVLQVSPGGL